MIELAMRRLLECGPQNSNVVVFFNERRALEFVDEKRVEFALGALRSIARGRRATILNNEIVVTTIFVAVVKRPTHAAMRMDAAKRAHAAAKIYRANSNCGQL